MSVPTEVQTELAVQLRAVSKTYGEGGLAVHALREVDLEIRPEEFVVLLGPSGSGKTTLAHLIPRFYDVTSGAVLVDGQDVRKYHLQALRSGIALVPQDVVVFAGTVRENITLGSDHSDEEAMESIRAVSAESLV